MKLFATLILSALSYSTFAQFKAEIRNSSEVATHGAVFPTLEEANAWVSSERHSGAWGKLERTILRTEATSEELASQVLEEIDAEGEEGAPDYIPPRVRLKQTFTVHISDISAEVAMASALKNAEKAMECGKSTQALLLVRNAVKNLTIAQVKSLVATYSSIKQLLDTGSLVSAAEEIMAIVPDGVLVLEADKTALVAKINECKP